MLTLQKSSVFVTHHIRSLRGGTQAVLAEASDGHLYVVKFNAGNQGANLPFNESAGSELYRAVNLPSPEWAPLLVRDSFLDENPACRVQTMDGAVRPDAGLCFGSRYLGEGGVRLLEILPGGSFKRVNNHASFWLSWLIDICAGHTDNRQAIFLEDQAGWLNAVFLDHGHMFGGPHGDEQRHFLASRYLDPRVYQDVSPALLESFQKIVQEIDVDGVWQTIQSLPEDWKTGSALSAASKCLNRIADAVLLRNVLDTMVDAQRQANERERKAEYGPRRKTAASVTSAASHGKGTKKNVVPIRPRKVACA
jgi:hypothetical protein